MIRWQAFKYSAQKTFNAHYLFLKRIVWCFEEGESEPDKVCADICDNGLAAIRLD